MVHVISVEIIDLKADVFDIEIEQDHSFIVGDVVVHNSAICRARSRKVFPLIGSGQKTVPGFPADRQGKPPFARPPAHPNCLPGDALVLPRGRITGVSKRWFDGEVIVIRMADDLELTCTPNHPILTRQGWRSAQMLDTTDSIIGDIGGQWPASLVDGEYQNMPACIQDIAEAFFRSGEVVSMPVPTSAEDFHGDGMDGEIAIVGADRLLMDRVNAVGAKHISELEFEKTDPGLVDFARLGSLDQLVLGFLPTANGFMGGGSETLAFSSGRSVHPGLLLLGAVPQMNAPLFQDTRDGGWADAEDIRDAANANSGLVSFHDVIGIERRDFRDHVYNLETETGTYLANGIVTHNCRSTMMDITKSFAELGIDAQDAPGMDGGIPPQPSYQEWLRTQDREFVLDVLGKTKGRAFLDGDLPLDRFVDNATGRELTIEQLRETELGQKAFKKAGLDDAA